MFNNPEKKKICLICEEEFTPSIYNKKLCSERCRLERRRKWFRKYMKEYTITHPTYIEYQKRYFKENRENFKRNKKNWYKTQKGKQYLREVRSQYKYKLKNKKWIPIFPNIFPKELPVDYHHVDGKWFVVPLPTNIHKMNNGKSKDHLEKNNEWIEFFHNFNVTKFLGSDPMELQK